ncbi:hypothetical protein [Candidatus Nitrospira bockiana]
MDLPADEREVPCSGAGIAKEGSWTIQMTAFDTAKNESAKSAPVSFTQDLTAPLPPGLRIQATFTVTIP